jgi:hypothetical protein
LHRVGAGTILGEASAFFVPGMASRRVS